MMTSFNLVKWTRKKPLSERPFLHEVRPAALLQFLFAESATPSLGVLIHKRASSRDLCLI